MSSSISLPVRVRTLWGEDVNMWIENRRAGRRMRGRETYLIFIFAIDGKMCSGGR